MLGHDTDFGQMECLKLITMNTFSEKRIGYLGLTQLFNEKSEVLMMATNRIRIDLTSPNNYIISLSLAALSEICTADMCRELAPQVGKLMDSSTASYIKKKAILAATRIIRKVPEMVDEFIGKIEGLIEEQNHGILLSALALIDDILQLKPAYKIKFKKFIPSLTKMLKGLVTSYSSEYDVSGISDPFLQVEILKFFRSMALNDQALSDEIGDILAQVATNTSSNKNSGNAVLFECVKTIMAIESVNTLRILGINILGKFLANKDSNSKYVSLYSLQKVLKHDLSAVQKHKATILECLKENDFTIKKLALDLLYLITNETNVKSIVKEMLNYLLVSEVDFMQDLTWKICTSIEKYSPNRRWYIDTLIRVLTLAGNYVKDESLSSLIHLISSTAQLQTYSVHKIFFCVRENINQDGLIKVGLWCLGEFGNLLVNGKAVGPDNVPINVSEEEVIDLIERILTKNGISDVCKEYAVTCLIKLYPKFTTQTKKIVNMIDSQTTSSSLEVQQRSCEYLKLIEKDWDENRAAILETMPICPSFSTTFSDKNVGDVEIDEVPPQQQQPSVVLRNIVAESTQQPPQNKPVTPVNNNNTMGNLIDLDDLLGKPHETLHVNTNNQIIENNSKNNNNNLNALNEIFATNPNPAVNLTNPSLIQTNNAGNFMSLYGSTNSAGLLGSNMNPQPNLFGSVNVNLTKTVDLMESGDLLGGDSKSAGLMGSSNFKAFEDQNLELVFQCIKVKMGTFLDLFR